ncbi:MAG: PKD domain-containing protein [Bacteroidetes bacterium]|nr:PKD domain-containing protein [Bacteroidota bacterium]
MNGILRLKFFIAVFALLCVVRLSGQVTADFAINAPTNNCNPAIYSFSNNSIGIPPLTYEWNFGVYPGLNSVFANPSTTYLTCGSFAVKLITTNGLGLKDSITKMVVIRCSPKPSFTTSTLTGCLPMPVKFISTSQPGSGTITNLIWDFGDGSSGGGLSEEHVYTSSGCKNITLIATNSFGCVKDTTMNNVLCAYPRPTAAFSSPITTTCNLPLQVTYSNSSFGGTGPYNYRWIFEGGVPPTSTQATPQVTYNSYGSFTSYLVVVDANGCSDTIEKQNYINTVSSYVNFTLSSNTGCAPGSITTSAVTTSTPLSYNWTASPSAVITNPNSKNATFTFSDTGTYDLCLLVDYGNNCIGSRCSTVVINPAPLALFRAEGLFNTCQKPNLISFVDSSSGTNLAYDWSFNGGIPASANTPKPPMVVYDSCGTYTARLTVTNDFGCSSIHTLPAFMTITCPKNSIVVAPRYGCIPLSAGFTSGMDDGSPVSWLWDFGDTASGVNNISTLENPSHTFNDPGCYKVTLTTTTTEGCSVTTTMGDAVCGGHRPHPNFSANPPVNCVNQPVYFSDSSTGTFEYTKYVWDFYGGPPYDNMSNDKNPVYAYGDTGVFDITLIVSNYGCADTITKDDYVKILAPVALPKVITDCKNPLQVVLDGSGSTGGQRYKWIIPGGSPAVASSAVVIVTYPATGSYTATLIVYNDSTGCSDLGDISFSPTAGHAQFTASPLFSCAPSNICVNNTSIDAISHLWQLISSANGSVVTTSTARQPCFNINTAGIYGLRLIVTDAGGCKDTLYRPDYIQVNKPAANFIGAPLTGCVPLTSSFSDSSSVPASSAPIVSWHYTFGDLASGSQNISTVKNPSHIFNFPGSYTIAQTVTDSTGCANTKTRNFYVVVGDPKARFTSPDTVVCNGSTICFKNTSSGNGLKYSWDFGDGTTSTVANPCRQYAVDSGLFNISLSVMDEVGCRDTTTRSSYINIQKFTAALMADVTTSNCPPLAVQFSNISRNTTSGTMYKWSFGDAQVSTLVNPFHIYNAPGSFNVSLIAVSPKGCTDTLVLNDYIRIGGPVATITQAPTSGCAPHRICMAVNSPNAVSYTWNLGDGTVKPGRDTICYTYESTGIFFPEIILSDTAGCVYAKPLGVIHVGGAVSHFNNEPAHICGPQTILFSDSSYGISAIQSISWNFGDSTSGPSNNSSQLNPSHHFSNPGSYNVTHRIMTTDGCSNTSQKVISVHPTLILNITLSDTAFCGPDTVYFTDKTVHLAPYNYRFWSFGDPISGNENFSGLPDPSHYYSTPGYHPVSLIVVDVNGCTDTAFTGFTLFEQPVAAFSAFDTCLNSQPIIFQNSSLYAGHYRWDFGDGSSSTVFQPKHTFADTGSYQVRLAVNNKYCYDSASAFVRIQDLPNLSFQLNSNFLCGPPAVFAATNTSTDAHSFFWNFGNGIYSTELNAVDSFMQPGVYVIQLSGQNQFGCRDTVSDSITVYPYPKTNHIYLDPLEGCAPFTLSFTADVTNGTSYTWDFGDGSVPVVSENPTVSHTYTDTGSFTLRLKTISFLDCADNVVLWDTVKVYVAPVAAFEYTLNSIGDLIDGTVDFTNQSLNATHYEWEFGDGSFSVEEIPTHLYSDINEFNVILYAITDYGCRDSATASFYVVKKSLYVPNAFAPDHYVGESLVRIWKPVGIGLKEYRASVYNTWGELIWESTALTEDGKPVDGWDGTYRGKACQQDVYVWKVEAVFLDNIVWEGMSYKKGQPRKTMGDVTLIR